MIKTPLLTPRAHAIGFASALLMNVAVLILSFLPALSSLWTSWQKDEYSHAPLIPLLALLLGWGALTEKKPKPFPNAWGLTLLAAGFLMLFVSRLSAFEPPSHYGLIIALFGLVLSFFGKTVATALVPAFVYLFFAVPLPQLIYVGLSADMQLWSSALGVWFLHIAGIPVFQEGNVIDLGAFKLQVAEACNGLRYLFPLMSFGFLIAYLYQAPFWKRATLFLSTIPITILMNALRIALIGVTVNLWGIKMAEGVLHMFEGWIVFLSCILLLFAQVGVLKGWGENGAEMIRYDRLSIPSGKLFSALPRLAFISGLATALVFACGLFFQMPSQDARSEIKPQREALTTFPIQFSGWTGKEDYLSPEILLSLQLSDYWQANYTRDENASPVNLYIAYYESQRIGSSIHSPANCLPGGGWNMAQKSIQPIPLGDGKSASVTRLLITKEKQSLLVYYWFDGRSRILNDQYQAKWYLLIDSIMMHRTDGALVRVTTPVIDGDIASADSRLSSFIEASYPFIRRFVP